MKILIPLDGTPAAETILPFVRRIGGEICGLHVLPHRENEAAIRPYLDGLGFDYLFRTGRPAEQILSAGRFFDLIAMTTHTTGIDRLLLGSVTVSVLKHAEVPVLVARPEVDFRPWKKICAVVDGSRESEQILPDATEISHRCGGEVEVFTAQHAQEIVDHVQQTQAGLICKTTQAATGLTRILGRSVTKELLRISPVPLLIRGIAHSTAEISATR